VTSAHLRLAGGEVQCGACGARFDALDRLSDTYPRGPSPGRTDVEPEASPDAEPVAGGDSEPAAQASEAVPAEEGAEEAPAEPSSEDEPTEPALAETDVDVSITEEAAAPQGIAEEVPSGTDDEPTINLDVTAEELFSLEELQDQEMPDIGDLEFVEGLPSGQAQASAAAETTPPGEMLARRPSALLRWARNLLLLAIVLAIAAAVVYAERGTLMTNPALAPWLERIYGSIGLELEPSWQVSAYRIVESAAEIDGRGDLQVTLKFVNEAGFPQPYPVLRVSLEDRWGDEIGSRELPPQDYLAGYVAGRMLAPGRQVEGRATVSAPPPAAVGFRLDLCLADPADGLECMSNQP